MSLKDQTILVVEDELFISLDLAAALEHHGARVVTAKTLVEASALIETGVNAAVVDHVLPDGDSEKLCEHLHERASRSSTTRASMSCTALVGMVQLSNNFDPAERGPR